MLTLIMSSELFNYHQATGQLLEQTEFMKAWQDTGDCHWLLSVTLKIHNQFNTAPKNTKQLVLGSIFSWQQSKQFKLNLRHVHIGQILIYTLEGKRYLVKFIHH